MRACVRTIEVLPCETHIAIVHEEHPPLADCMHGTGERARARFLVLCVCECVLLIDSQGLCSTRWLIITSRAHKVMTTAIWRPVRIELIIARTHRSRSILFVSNTHTHMRTPHIRVVSGRTQQQFCYAAPPFPLPHCVQNINVL